jgi:hypothetical protein
VQAKLAAQEKMLTHPLPAEMWVQVRVPEAVQ